MKLLLLRLARLLPARRLRCRVRGCTFIFLDDTLEVGTSVVCDRCLSLGTVVSFTSSGPDLEP